MEKEALHANVIQIDEPSDPCRSPRNVSFPLTGKSYSANDLCSDRYLGVKRLIQ